MLKEILHFILHLRLHYQFLILSGGYLLGGFLAGEMNVDTYLWQFLNVHILLFGGATAYNSWWDKDKGSIGGLKHPPKMEPWMHPASLALMFAGQAAALKVGIIYSIIYFTSMLLFWLYSTPLARWKSTPHLSLFAIAASTGLNSVLLGLLAAGGSFSLQVLLAAAGASIILVSLYPVSQIFQIEEDRQRGDTTFALQYGVAGVKRFFLSFYTAGSLLLCIALMLDSLLAGTLLLAGTTISGIIIAQFIFGLSGRKEEYRIVMKTKFYASLSFVTFFLAAIIIRYS